MIVEIITGRARLEEVRPQRLFHQQIMSFCLLKYRHLFLLQAVQLQMAANLHVAYVPHSLNNEKKKKSCACVHKTQTIGHPDYQPLCRHLIIVCPTEICDLTFHEVKQFACVGCESSR